MPDFSSLDSFTLGGSLAGGAILVGIVYVLVYLLLRPPGEANPLQQGIPHCCYSAASAVMYAAFV
jgi:hypothetical protein